MEAAQEATDRLLTEFPGYDARVMSQAVFEVADAYYWYGHYPPADELYNYVIDTYPLEKYGMWANMGLAISNVASGNDEVVRLAVERLTTDYFSDPSLPEALGYIAGRYEYDKRYEEALNLYTYILEVWPDGDRAIWAIAGIAKIDIALGEESTADVIVDNLVADYKDDSALPEALFQIGEQYWKLTGSKLSKDRNEHTYDYLGRAMAVWKRIEDLPPVDITPKAAFFVAECYFCSDLPQDAIVAYQAFADNWKEHKYACISRERIVNVYVKMIIDGSMSMPEAEAQIEVIYEELLEQSPNGSQSIRNNAQRWLNYYRKKMKKETGILSDERIISTFEQQANQGGSQ